MKDKENTKTVRLYQLEHLLFQKKYGVTKTEIAEKCGINDRTVYRYIKDLEDAGVPIYQNGSKWCVRQDYYLPPVHFSRPEAMVIFLASRLMLHYTNRADPYIRSAFYKMNVIVPSPIKEQLWNSIEWMEKLPRDKKLARHMEDLTSAWVTQRTVKMNYQSYGEKPKFREVDPYFIQPTDFSHASYLIAYCHLNKEIRVFKIARIKSLEITVKKYKIPETFNADKFLEPAWGVIGGTEPELVKLVFSSKVAQMFDEAVYHPSQTIEHRKDGSALVTLKVVPSIELINWVVGWGEDVEVIAPKKLRGQVEATAIEMTKVYKIPSKISAKRKKS